MHSYWLDFALIGVTENFTEGDQDGPWRDFRALCRTQPNVCDATGGNGERLCSSEVECGFSCRGGGSVRTRVVVFDVGRCNQPGGVPDYSFDPCHLCALARPHPSVGQSAVRQAQSCRTCNLACPGAAHSGRSWNLDRADERMPCRLVAWLACADSGWQSSPWERTPPGRVARNGRRGFARSGTRPPGSTADDHRGCFPLRRRSRPGAVVAGSSAAGPSATRLVDRRPEL